MERGRLLWKAECAYLSVLENKGLDGREVGSAVPSARPCEPCVLSGQ